MNRRASDDGVGIYGKLPSKRDYVALHVGAPVLAVIEDWLQAGVAASKRQMGERWQDAFLTMPLWRFWLGEQVAGTWCVGSLMPSMDGVGRYFPLTIVSQGQPGELMPPPRCDSPEKWFAQAEARLLSALEPGQRADPIELIRGLPSARSTLDPWPVGGSRPGRSSFTQSDDDRIEAQKRTYWWTNGGERFGARYKCRVGMPDPGCYVNLMTGEV